MAIFGANRDMVRTTLYSIYVKKSPSGLYYLGQTSKNPYKYKGSGKYWLSHCKKHNYQSNHLETWVLHQSTSLEEIAKLGLYYSSLFKIVESESWANLTVEQGQGNAYWTGKKRPDVFKNREGKLHWTRRPEVREKLRKARTGTTLSEATKLKISEKHKNKTVSTETRQKLSISKRGEKNPSSKRKRGLSSSAKKLIDPATGKTFECFKDAADYYKVHYTTISRRIKNNLLKLM